MLELLQILEAAALCVAAAIAVIILTLWFLPILDQFAPPFWSKMSANAAAAILISAGSLALALRQGSPFRRGIGTALGALVLALSALTLLEYLTGRSFGIDTLLPHALKVPYPDRPTPQGALALMLLGICTLTLRQSRNFWSGFADITALLFLMLNFVMLGGEFFGAMHHLSIYSRIIMSPQTLFSFFCFSVVVLLRRAEQGELLAVLVNIGIGSRMVRLILPAALALPFVLFAAESWLARSGSLDVVYAQSITAAFAAILLLGVLIWTGWLINALERDLRDMSLTDELTGVFNRRGFYFLGQQAIREAQRAHSGLSLFFFDLDGLKHVNDLLGHETGSEMIKSFAAILHSTFRKSDIVGRVGGDEFAVITIRDDAMWIDSIYARLHHLTEAHNNDAGKSYRLSFSTGYAELSPGHADSLDSLVIRADSLMYKDKARKKLAA